MMEEINEVADLLSFVKSYSELPSEMVFRGQNEDWQLLPSLLRKNKESNLKIEKELFKRLKLNKPILPEGLEDSYDFLIFAQQHSMPTRLLDWTYSPLISLWFSCFNSSGNFEEDGYVYMLDSTSLEDARRYTAAYDKSEDAFKRHLAGLEGLMKLIPSPLFERMTSQNGIFTVFPDYPKIEKYNIQKIKVPQNRKVSILKELGKLKINQYTIYKDYDSFCKTIYWEVYGNKSIYSDTEPPFFDVFIS